MSTFRERLDEADRFFEKRGKVHKTMYRMVERLEREGIPYAVIGTMALNAHGYVRVTTNVDLLITPDLIVILDLPRDARSARSVSSRRVRLPLAGLSDLEILEVSQRPEVLIPLLHVAQHDLAQPVE